MEKFYICPQCRGHLKVGEYIVFAAKNARKNSGLLLLHPRIGNYTSIKHPSFDYIDGESIDFYCPLCQNRLVASFDENLVYVIMIDRDQKEYDIYFSRIAGEQSTYQVRDDTVMSAGEDSSKYTYFKMSDKFKKFLK